MIDEIEPGRFTEDLLNEVGIAPGRADTREGAPLVVVAAGLEIDVEESPARVVVVGFLTAASDTEARGLGATELVPDFREVVEPEGEMTEARAGAAPDSVAGLLPTETVRDVVEAASLVPPAREVRRVGVAAPPEGTRALAGVAFGIVEPLVDLFKGEEVVGVAGLADMEVGLEVVFGFIEWEFIVVSQSRHQNTVITYFLG